MQPFEPMNLPLKFIDGEESIAIKNVDFYDLILQYTKSVTKFNTVVKKTRLNMDLIFSTLITQEAIFSTRIEGTQATLTDVYEAEASDKKSTNNDVLEVLNYKNAIKDAQLELDRVAISTRLFKTLHKILMSGNVRGRNKSPGEFRRIQNYIGPEGCTINTASFVPPSPERIDEFISNLEEFINEDTTLHPILRTAIFHAQFETIHPFLDGNGRLGRVMIPICLYYFNEIESVNFFVSQSLEKNKFLYYTLLNNTRKSTVTAWKEWIEFFVKAVIEQTDYEVSLIEKIDEFYDETLNKVTEIITSKQTVNIVRFMFKSPIFTAKRMLEEINMNANTLRSYLKKLEDNRIIISNEASRNKTYYFYGLLNILKD